MSIWGDMLDRGTGEKIKKEDLIADPLGTLEKSVIVYIGPVDRTVFPTMPAEKGQLYYVKDEVTIEGVTFPAGSGIVYDGTKWVNVGGYTVERVDANIDYLKPDSGLEYIPEPPRITIAAYDDDGVYVPKSIGWKNNF